MWLGIAANLALAMPTIAAPDQMVAFSRLPTVTPHLWARFAGPAADPVERVLRAGRHGPDRYRANAWLAVVSRLAGVVFFIGEPAYRLLGLFDLVFFVPEAVLLFVATRAKPPSTIAARDVGEPAS